MKVYLRERKYAAKAGGKPERLPYFQSWLPSESWHLLDLLSHQWKPERTWKRLVWFCDGAEENDESHLIELDIEEGEGLEEYQDVGEEEEDDVEEEGIEEEELVSSQNMAHSVIVVAPRRWV